MLKRGRRTTATKRDPATPVQSHPTGDPRLPGAAGYRCSSLEKNAMPAHRFTFVRPDGRSEPEA